MYNSAPHGILLLILYNFPIKATTAENDIKMMSTRMQLYTRRFKLKLNIFNKPICTDAIDAVT